MKKIIKRWKLIIKKLKINMETEKVFMFAKYWKINKYAKLILVLHWKINSYILKNKLQKKHGNLQKLPKNTTTKQQNVCIVLNINSLHFWTEKRSFFAILYAYM